MPTTTKTATVTYTAEQTVDLVAAYTAADTVEKRDLVKAAYAIKFGKGVRSIVAKLVREGVYKKAEYVTKAGEKPQPKNELADAIGAILFLSEPEIDSLTKATKPALQKIFTALANSKPIGDGLTESEGKGLNRCNAATRSAVFAALELGTFEAVTE